MKKLRKLLAMMLTVVMCVSTVSETGFAVFAADDETDMSVAQADEAEAEEPEEPVTEEREGETTDDGAAPTKLEICFAGEMKDLLTDQYVNSWQKNLGYKWGCYYNNGVLLLVNAPIADNSKAKQQYGIDCAGNLKILVLGSCNIELQGLDLGEVSGINVNGDLEIQNADADSIKALASVIPEKDKTVIDTILQRRDKASLSINGISKNGGFGISCTGDLDIHSADFLKTQAETGTPKTGCDLEVSAYAPEYTADGGDANSIGIYANNILINDVDVNAYGRISKNLSMGIRAGEELNIASGKLSACSAVSGTNDPEGADSSNNSTAVYAFGDISIGSEATVAASASGADPHKHWGIFSKKGNIDIKGRISSKTSGSTLGNIAVACGDTSKKLTYSDDYYIELPDTLPDTGLIKDVDSVKAICDMFGNVAGEVEIVKGTAYGLWIGGVRVTSNNKDNIPVPGDGASAKYDPDTKTLTLDKVKGDYRVTVPGNVNDNYINSVDSLKLRGNAEIVIGYTKRVIQVWQGDLDIEGQYNFASGSECIKAKKAVSVDGADTVLTCRSVFDDSPAAITSESFTMKDGTLDLRADGKGKGAAIVSNGGPIKILGGTVNAKGENYAIAAGNSEVILDESMRISKPAGGAAGTVTDEGKTYGTIVDSEGNAAKEVDIRGAYKPLVVTQADVVYGNEPAPEFTKPAEDVTVTVSYNGTLKGGSVYASTEKPVKVGDYRVTVEAKNNTDVWRGTADFKITEKAVTATVKAVDRIYAEGNKAVELSDNAADQTITGLVEGEDVTLDLSSAAAEMADDNSGEGKAVTVSGVALKGKDSKNYILSAQPTGVTVNIEKAEWDDKSVSVEAEIGKLGGIQLAGMRAPGASFGEAVVTEGADQFVTAPYMNGTILEWEAKSGISKVLAKVTIPVTGATNYKDYSVEALLSSDEVFTVYFNLGGHGKSFIDAQDIISGNCVVKPEDPVDDDYNFRGWYTESEFTNLYNFSTPVTESFTLYAKWTAKGAPGSGHSALDTWPLIDDSTTDIWLVKGQKFYIGTDWTIDKSVKKYAVISKKGIFTAKKETVESTPVEIKKGDTPVRVHISKPSVEKKMNLEITDAGVTVSKAFPLTKVDDLDVYYYSASPDVATVDETTGVVTAVAKGTAKVTAYINGKAYTCSVVVKESVAAKDRTLHMAKGSKKTINIKGLKNPEWLPDAEGIVDVKKSRITALAPGKVVLTAVSGENTYKVTVYVEDLTLTGEKLTGGKSNKYSMELNAGVETTVSGSASLDQALIFKCSKPDVAFIDEDGNIVARRAGKCKFTAKLDGKTVTINVAVK